MKIYLETSVISGSLDEDEPRFMKFSNHLIKSIKENTHRGFVSKLVLEEVSKAPLKRRIKLERKISRSNLVVLEIDERVLDLAKRYVEEGLIPEKYRADAIHIAAAVVNSLDALASWNLSHIVRTKTINGVNAINKTEGYRGIRIVTPETVVMWQK